MRAVIIYLVIMFLLGSTVFPEETSLKMPNTIKWHAALELASFRDDLIVPLGFHGPGVIIGSSFQHNRGEWQFDLPLSYKFDFVFNRYSHMGMAFSLDINPSLLKSIDLAENQGHFKGGLAFPFKINNYFPFSWDDAHLYWFTIRGIALAMEWTTPAASDRAITLHLEIPLLNQISRPPAYRHNKQDPGLAWGGFKSTEAKRNYKTVSWADYQSVRISGEYVSTPKSSWILEFEYDHATMPKEAWAISTSLRYARKFRSW
ncbi:MAG: hypothetical protein HOB84_13920 [Candidatus Marinimicrobia bacterium]|jgi:hypothetical protein|nr:hypothetical protein [Candidatus Neomarinimicrobiota bacterium]MBT4361748.1 hypothetical protein [Candidatus Neomarinimicrobiota bacterium]MBT4715860.1 hypothetical protein [Candidatus Neomarinimicrobiota bacterium]MBT4947799.1 hypothetical protein [Candidatus Neomarinimicrobiota bacterium]MBT5271286.1 hypothetical protein [Candidatus Neomarinimicrobiota bacterium]